MMDAETRLPGSEITEMEVVWVGGGAERAPEGPRVG